MSNKVLANELFESIIIWAFTKNPSLTSQDVVANIEKILDIVESKCNETKLTKVLKLLKIS
jgi:hypothetical protein